MNRAILITTGIIIILLVLGVWVYLMLFGAPDEKGEVFTNLGFDIGQQSTTIAPPLSSQPLDTLVDTQSSDTLHQLTTRPIAGYTFATTTTNEQTVRYIERGTGHMYEINLTTGQEDIISVTTIPQVVDAVFSPTKNTVALTSYEGYNTQVFIGTISRDQSLTGIDLEPNAKNISFTDTGELLYSVSKNGVTKGYRHNLETQTKTEEFSFNYTSVDVGWGGGLQDIYLATKPAHNLEGFIYKTIGNTLTPAIPAQYGLSAFYSNNYIIATYARNGAYQSTAFISKDDTAPLPILALKEKCTFDAFSQNHLWCAAPIEAQGETFVENWYKGIETSLDYLWLVSITDGSAQLYGDLEELSGRTIDVKQIQINPTGDTIAFTNKIDQTLWSYDLTQ
jgi:hypothetical protein